MAFDLIIGAYGADPNGVGAAGKPMSSLDKENNSPIKLSDIADGNGGFVIHGEEKRLQRFAVSSAGDVNGDGVSI